MPITLSPEKRAFVEREIAAGAFRSETDAVERALTFYERHLQHIRAAIEEAELEIVAGKGATLTADEHLALIRANVAKNP